MFRSDGGGEFFNQPLSQFFQDHGMLSETICTKTPEQNGVAERKIHHILETAWALLLAGNVPKRYWADAITYAVYLLNRMPFRLFVFHTPLVVLVTHVSITSFLNLPPRIFGCVAYVYLHKHHHSKLDPCALRCVFLGFSPPKKGYKCYHPSSQRWYITMDVTFLKSEMFFSSNMPNHVLQGVHHSHLCEEHIWFDVSMSTESPIELSDTFEPMTLPLPLPASLSLITLVPVQPALDVPKVSLPEPSIISVPVSNIEQY